MLTSRAQQYVETFERRPSVPLDEIKRLFQESGLPCFDVWLEFHARYAGLLDGAEGLLLGLAHAADGEIPALQLRVKFDDWGQECRIQVANTDDRYELDSRGRLRYERVHAESFEMKMERDALLWEFRQQGTTKYLIDETLCDNLLLQLENHWVPEASDKFVDCYRSARYLIFVDARTRRVDEGYENLHGLGIRTPAPAGPKPRLVPGAARAASAFLPVDIHREYDLASDPYRRLVQRLSLLGNLPHWDPKHVSIALGVELSPLQDDPSDPERRYVAGPTDVFETVRLILPTHRSQLDAMLNLGVRSLSPAEPGVGLAPILAADTQPQIAWPKAQAGKTPKLQGRVVEVGITEVEFVFEGEAFLGPQRVKSVSLTRPRPYAAPERYAPEQFRAEPIRGTEYAIRRIDDGSEAVHVIDITENRQEQDRLAIRFRCLDLAMTPQDGSGLVTALIVQGLRLPLYLNRVEYLDYTEVDTGVEYTRLWNQRSS